MAAYLASSPLSYVSPDRDFLSPVSNLTAKLQWDTSLNVGVAARSLLSHGPDSNQISSRGGLISAEKRGTSLEPDRDGNESREETMQQPWIIHRPTFLLKREERDSVETKMMGRGGFTHSGQAFTHPFIQDTFIQYLLCQAWCWGLENIRQEIIDPF